MYYEFRPYVPVRVRRARAEAHAKKLAKNGRKVQPVRIEGRTIAKSFWGKAWCDNLESYSDYANRMPRGRSYVRNGSVVDLQIEAGRITSIVSGSEIYQIKIEIERLEPERWQAVVRECAGQIGSLVELLKGQFSDGVMQLLARPKTGLFPAPQQIRMSCSCPDWATMCKHVAATLYGVGARLDREPQIFFTLRQVDQTELVSEASSARTLGGKGGGRKQVASDELSALFGIELESGDDEQPAEAQPAKRSAARKPAARKPAARKPAARKLAAKKPAAKKPAAKKALAARRVTKPRRSTPAG